MTAQPLPVPPIPETLTRLNGSEKDTWYQMRHKRGEHIGLALMKASTKVSGKPILICAAVQATDVTDAVEVASVVKTLRGLIDDEVTLVAELLTHLDIEVTLEEIGSES